MNIKSTTYRLSLDTGEIVNVINHSVQRGVTDDGLLNVMTANDLNELKQKGFVWTELKLPFLHTMTRYEVVS